MSITKITDHVERGLARLPMQFRGKPNFESLLTVLLTPVQRFEDAMWQVLTERGIDNAVGEQLATLGRIVGQPNTGLADADYRRYVRARIAVNKSSGRPEDLIAVAQAVLGSDSQVIVQRSGTATVIVELTEIIDAATATAMGTLLQATVDAGVRLIFIYTLSEPDDTFTLDVGPGLDVGHLAGSL